MKCLIASRWKRPSMTPLMVVCNDDFYVCPHCGYAESTTENMEVAGFNSHQKTLEKKHITPWGKTWKSSWSKTSSVMYLRQMLSGWYSQRRKQEIRK